MAITLVASSKREDTVNATTRTITVPAGVQDGDFIMLVVCYGGGSTTNSATGLTGLQKLGDGQGAGITSTVYYRQNALASDAGTNITVTLSTSLRTVLLCLVFRGVRTSGNAFNVQASVTGEYATPVIAPTGQTTAASTLPLQIITGSRTTFEGTWQGPGWIDGRVEGYAPNSGAVVVWPSAEVPAGTSIGGETWTPPALVNWAAWTIALDSGSTGSAPTVTTTGSQSKSSGEVVTLTASSTGPTPTSWEWTQLSGPAVELNGTGATRTFAAPAYQQNTTLSFGVRAYNGAAASNQAVASVSVSPHQWWHRQGSNWRPIRRRTLLAGNPFELTAADDTPTFSYSAVGASAGTTIAGSAGWLREKRVGVATTPAGGTQSATTGLDLAGDTRFKYGGVPMASAYSANPAQYVSTPLKPGGVSQNAHWLFNLEFETESPVVEIRLNAPVANPRLGLITVNGKLVSETAIGAEATAGSGYAAKLTFPTAKLRRIMIHGLNHNTGRFGGVAVAPGHTVTRPATSQGKRIAIIGDSWVNGALGSPPAGASSVETFAWRLARLMGGDEFIQAGIGGTGWLQTTGGEADSVYSERVADVMSTNPDVVIFTGGRNDSSTGLRQAVEATLDATAGVAERYVIATNSPGQTAQRTAMQQAANAKGVAYVDGSDTGIELGTDGVHPTFAGHKALATALYERVVQVGQPGPGPGPGPDPDPDPPDPGEEASEGLFFKLPQTDSPKLVLGHFFGPYPIVLDNVAPENDYYARNYLSVDGESGTHAAYGGFLRDRPKTNWPYPNPYLSTQMHDEINHAKQAGIDGFFVNIMGSGGANWDRYVALADVASASHPGFWVVPMVDANGSMAQNDSESVNAARINTLLSKSSAYRLSDGRYLLGSFKAEGRSVAWWQSVINILQNTHGKQVAFVGVYNNINQAANYTNVPQYASGPWGPGADPNIFANHGDYAGPARSRGEKVLSAVWPQDIRPRGGLFDESLNTGSLRAAWTRAINDNADIVQLCSWSDYSEGSQVQPSAMRGHVAADLSAYYITRWKTGSFPTILRDAMYVSHRNQMANATITGGQTELMSHWPRGNRSAFREHVEILTFLTASASISVKIGSTTHTYTAPAGMNIQTYPMQPGHVSAKAVRASTEIARVNSPVVIKSTSVNQDRQYAMFSSLRGTAEQYDPTPGSPTPNPSEYIT